jgi:hypothetical protein
MKEIKEYIVNFLFITFFWVSYDSIEHWYKGTDGKTIFYYIFDVKNLRIIVIFFFANVFIYCITPVLKRIVSSFKYIVSLWE